MWVTGLITAAFVVAFIAAEFFAVQQREQDAERERARLGDGAAQPGTTSPGFTPVHHVTSDEIVHELEHRIDEELRDISYAMRAPERYRQIFEA